MKVDRQTLLAKLESVSAGLAPRETIDQATCFLLKGGWVHTYSEEIFCKTKTGLDDAYEGAVAAKPLLEILKKLQEDSVEVSIEKDHFHIQGKGRKAGVRVEKKLVTPLDALERPDKWKKIPEGFLDAVEVVKQTASDDESMFNLTCVHVHPEFLESYNVKQYVRYPLRTGLEVPILVKRDALKHVVGLGMSKWAETPTWLHFKNESGLYLSCLRYAEEFTFPDLSAILKLKGKKATLPRGLAEVCEKAEVFSAIDRDNNHVEVQLRPDKIKVTGRGALGYYQEYKKAKYAGDPLTFVVSPKLLAETINHHTDCEVGPGHIKIDAGKYLYFIALSRPEDDDNGGTAAVSGNGDRHDGGKGSEDS